MATSTIIQKSSHPAAYNWREYADINTALKAECFNLGVGFTVGAAFTSGGALALFAAAIGSNLTYAIAYTLTQYGNIKAFRTTDGGTNWAEYTIS